MKLTDVSKTAIVTLRCHAIESKKAKPLIDDPMAEYCLENLILCAAKDEKALLFERKLSSRLSMHIALRARKYDALINDFISKNPGCTVVNLGCGFDTRYWRIDHAHCKYIELDLPEIIELKRDALQGQLSYELIPVFGFRYGLDRPGNLAGEPEFPAGCRGSVDVPAPGRGNQPV